MNMGDAGCEHRMIYHFPFALHWGGETDARAAAPV
jgi:hypothetical protein